MECSGTTALHKTGLSRNRDSYCCGSCSSRFCCCVRPAAPILDQIERQIEIPGPLDADQRQRMMEIADRCPVHRTLQGKIDVVTTEKSPAEEKGRIVSRRLPSPPANHSETSRSGSCRRAAHPSCPGLPVSPCSRAIFPSPTQIPRC